MTKIQLDRDEWFPVVTVGEGREYEVPAELLARFRAAGKAYGEANNEMLALMRKQEQEESTNG